MSERQAKKQKKTQPEVSKRHSGGKSSMGMNAVMILIVAAVLALGVYALASSYRQKKANQPDDTANQSQTVAQYAEENGTTAEEFLASYGLDSNEEITADTDMNVAAAAMTLEKFAEFSGQSVEDLKEQYGFGDNVTNDMLWSDAQSHATVEKMWSMYGMSYEDALASYNLTEEELPRDTEIADAEPILQAAIEKIQAEQAEATAQPEESAEPSESPSAE